MALAARIDADQLVEEMARAAKKLGPDVVHVRYEFAEDHSGEPALYFRVVLTDEAARSADRLSESSRIWESSRRINALLNQELRPYERGLRLYINYRSESEFIRMNDPAWA